MKWLFLILKLRELRRLHKYNEERYWSWLKVVNKYDQDDERFYQAYDQAIFYEQQMRKLESQIKLLT